MEGEAALSPIWIARGVARAAEMAVRELLCAGPHGDDRRGVALQRCMIMPTPVRQARSLRIAALHAPPTMLLIAVLLAALAVALLIVYQNRFSSKEYNASLADYAATMM
jgi:hypothetical protein